MILVGLVKKKSHMLLTQAFQFGFQSLGNLVLGSVNGFISCIISVIRIFVFTKMRVTVWLKLFFLGIQFALSLWMGADNIYEWIPFLSCVAYTWYLDTESPITFKIVNFIGSFLWVFHDFHYRNFAAFTFDILTLFSLIIGIGLIIHDRKKVDENSKNS